jgi:hypothetical protein
VKWILQKAEIMAMTKDLQYWLPADIIAQLKLQQAEGDASTTPFITQQEPVVDALPSPSVNSYSRGHSRGKSRASAASRPRTGSASDDEGRWAEVAAAHLKSLKSKADQQHWKQKQLQHQPDVDRGLPEDDVSLQNEANSKQHDAVPEEERYGHAAPTALLLP